MEEYTSLLFGVWFLIGAALVFWMQAGFAMVEAGFTRAKNTGNIIMKNLMDFCIGTVMFIILGFGLMFGEDTLFGLVGKPSLQIFTCPCRCWRSWRNTPASFWSRPTYRCEAGTCTPSGGGPPGKNVQSHVLL